METQTPQSYLKPAHGAELFTWTEEEYDSFQLGPRSKIFFLAAVLLITAWALYTDSPLMAITFILIGIVGYLLESRPLRIQNFHITTKGILVADVFYPFESIESFDIYEHEPFVDTLSLHTAGQLVSHIHIPTRTIDNDALAEILTPFVPEIPHEPNLLDTLQKILHI